MPLPVPNLDDRRFDDLVAEARQRLGAHLPELTQIAPGDPVHSFVDLFAWLTETILYRANLIPERQRRVVLNLLQIPVRPARAARGVVCVDAAPRTVRLPAVLPDGSQLTGGGQQLSTVGEIQPTPLELYVTMKEAVDDETLAELGFTREELHEQHELSIDETAVAFQPRAFDLGHEALSLSGSLDHAYYLALAIPKANAANLGGLRDALSGIAVNIAVAPDDSAAGDEVDGIEDRSLDWDLMILDTDDEGEETVRFLPVEVISDSSGGGRRVGVVRLRLPRKPGWFQDLAVDDPLYAGVGKRPPELPRQVDPHRVALWLRLRCGEEPELPLGYLGVNGVEVVARAERSDLMLGIGSGQPDQVVDLPDIDIDADSLRLDVEEEGAWVRWQQVDILYGRGAEDRVYRLDDHAGRVHFGNGLSGRRPIEAMRIRAERYQYGGGAAGNLAGGEIKTVAAAPQLKVRHDWPLSGGADAEDVARAEQRIPQFLTHRNRAVTRIDFRLLALSNPVNPVARAEVVEGFMPGSSIRAVRREVPGVVSVFVLPPGIPAAAGAPKPTKGLLKDVFSYLLDRVTLGTELYVLSPEFVPMAVGVSVTVRDMDTEQATLKAVRQAVVDYLWALAPGGVEGAGWPMGEAVRPRELATRVARVDGVRAVNGLSVFARLGVSAGAWHRLNDEDELTLLDYQLPDLLGVSAQSGTGLPPMPSLPGAGGSGDTDDGAREVPAPVIPDLC